MPPRPTPTGQRARTRAMPTEATPAAVHPTEDQVRRRAFEIYIARGGAAGNPDSDWRQAEQELRGRLTLLGRP